MVENFIRVRLREPTTVLAVNGESWQHQRLRGVVVPVVSWRCLISPNLFARVGTERDDRSDIEVVAFAAQPVIPGGAIPGAEEYELRFRIVHNRVPRSSAAARLPPLA